MKRAGTAGRRHPLRTGVRSGDLPHESLTIAAVREVVRETPAVMVDRRADAEADRSARAPRLLVLEDEAALRDVIVSALRLAGFDAVGTGSGDDALVQRDALSPHLLLIDVTVPGLSGLDVCRAVRSRGDRTPIIFLTARDSLQDKLSAFALGADDYLTKPFSLEELVARVRAVLARTAAESPDEDVLAFEDLEMDLAAHVVRRAGRPVPLTPTEFRLLQFLLENAGRVVSKDQILEQVWRYEYRGDASVVENYISFLRRKIDDREPRLIHTVRGVGYTLRREPS
jgi:two-component system OmpR family response regulator